MRSAWKVRVAGCLPRSRVRTALATAVASCAVVRMGSRSRWATIDRAMRPAKRSSPRAPITSRISSAVAVPSHCAALVPCVGSMRMSSGPSCWKLKPRCAWSSCGEDTPRSNRIPRQGRPSPCVATSDWRAPNGACTATNRGSAWKRSPSRSDGLRVAIDREQAALWAKLVEDACCVTAASERCVDKQVAPLRGRPCGETEGRDRLVDKHRCVLIQ